MSEATPLRVEHPAMEQRDVVTGLHLRGYRGRAYDLAARSVESRREMMARELAGTRRFAAEVIEAVQPHAPGAELQRMRRLSRVGQFAGVVLLSMQQSDRAFVAGTAWGVVSDRKGKGGEIISERIGARTLRIQHIAMRTLYNDPGYEALMLEHFVAADPNATRVGITLPEENSFAYGRLSDVGLRVEDRSVDPDYFGRGAVPAHLLHMEADTMDIQTAIQPLLPSIPVTTEIMSYRKG